MYVAPSTAGLTEITPHDELPQTPLALVSGDFDNGVMHALDREPGEIAFVSDVDAEDLPTTVRGHPVATTTAIEVTCPPADWPRGRCGGHVDRWRRVTHTET